MKRPKVLVVDGMFPNKYTSWRNIFLDSLLDEFKTDILVYKVDEFAGIKYDFDLDYIKSKYRFRFEHYNLLVNKTFNKPADWNKENFIPINLDSKFSYIYSQESKFSVDDYEVVYCIFLTSYNNFINDFPNFKGKILIHLFPGGGYDYTAKMQLDKKAYYISTHPLTSLDLKRQACNYIECLGGPHVSKQETFETHFKKPKSKGYLNINFSSMGFPNEKGEKEYVKLSLYYKLFFFWHKVKFRSIGNCKKTKFITNHGPLEYDQLALYYRDYVDIQVSLPTRAAPNGWPLGIEALKAGCILITTDPNNVSRYYLHGESILIPKNLLHLMLQIRSLYKSKNFFNNTKINQNIFFQTHFSYDIQQQKIFSFIRFLTQNLQ